jgi:hypothetical protein
MTYEPIFLEIIILPKDNRKLKALLRRIGGFQSVEKEVLRDQLGYPYKIIYTIDAWEYTTLQRLYNELRNDRKWDYEELSLRWTNG